MNKKTKGKTIKSSLIGEKYEHGKNPESLKNLKPFIKGESGNPGGRPKNYEKLKKSLDKWGEKKIELDIWDLPLSTSGETLKDQVLFAIWDKARKGNIKCIEILAQLRCLDDK